jgi:hypothetical protein
MVSRMMTQEFWLVLAARVVIGLLAAWTLGAIGFFVAFYVIFPGTASLVVLTPTIVSLTALGSGAGGMAAWFRPDRRRWVTALGVSTLIAAAVGGWAGFLAGTPDRDPGVIDIQTGRTVERGSPVTELITTPGLSATVLGGTLAANLAGAAGYVLRFASMREMRSR